MTAAEVTTLERKLAVVSQALAASELSERRALSDARTAEASAVRAEQQMRQAERARVDAESEIAALHKLVAAPPPPDAREHAARRALSLAETRLLQSEADTELVMLYARDLEERLNKVAEALGFSALDATLSEHRGLAYAVFGRRLAAIKESTNEKDVTP